MKATKQLSELYRTKEIWMFCGSQHLYGPGPLKEVHENAKKIAQELDQSLHIPVRITFRTVLTTADEIVSNLARASEDESCVGVILWMHTFSPAKMWIRGLKKLSKPLLHFHTQFNRDIPWDSIDMDYMNLHQSAHGGREFGFIASRLGLHRKVVTGHWSDSRVQEKIGIWSRAATAWADQQGARIARFGDNMRNVAVTEGNKVEAEIQLGYSVNGYGLSEFVDHLEAVPEGDIDLLLHQYEQDYSLAPGLQAGGKCRQSLRYAARQELGLRSFLEAGNFCGFTDTFENLAGLDQLPGLAVQRLMADGYGFGAEGDWKVAALVRAMKVMGDGLPGGTSFMEDYTYHFEPGRERVLGSHMLEICPSIATGKPLLKISPLGIGGKADPVRLVFDTAEGPALNASLVDLGNRLRLIVNNVDSTQPDEDLPKLPVARTLWIPRPDLTTAATAWIYAGGSHHTGFSQSVTAEMLEDYAEIAGIECVLINEHTEIRPFREQLRWNELYWRLNRSF
ncbi:L-arabinose isomerase [Alkalispirochaeta americana]|uniref:L-arabinose isomerase n=1 Tax=Alkalispirochaeta americana TaxID=159291 RepID=A0A1N6UL42_9SPIO|nr:L-arabinose isomerase [Alkalispirochaeta americana]SIQ66368.1 L-arabinose isomerase [Alkalispirochaeta americana]